MVESRLLAATNRGRPPSFAERAGRVAQPLMPCRIGSDPYSHHWGPAESRCDLLDDGYASGNSQSRGCAPPQVARRDLEEFR